MKTAEVLDVGANGQRDQPSDEPVMLLRVEQAARLLGLGRSTLYEAIGEGAIPVVRYGRTVRIARSDLAQWINDHRSAA